MRKDKGKATKVVAKEEDEEEEFDVEEEDTSNDDAVEMAAPGTKRVTRCFSEEGSSKSGPAH